MKKLISVVLITSLLFSFLALVGLAYEPYVNSEIVKISPITYVDYDSGEAITSITANTNVKAKTSVKAGDHYVAGQSITLILSVYSNHELLHYDEASILVPEKGARELTSAIAIPDMENLSLKAYVWDSLTNSRPLAAAAIFGENNAEVTELIIDGNPIENFDSQTKEYHYTFSAAHINYPEVSVVTANSAAKANIVIDGSVNDEHSTATIHITSPDGKATNSYVINFTKEQAVVTNARLNLPGKSPVSLTTETLTEPQWDEGKKPDVLPNNEYGNNKKDNDKLYENNLPTIRTRMYTDRNWYYMNPSPELMGGTSIITPYNTKDLAEAANTSIKNLVSFEINRSATIYLHLNGGSWTQLVNAGFTYDLQQAKGDRMMQYKDYYSFQPTYFYQKEVDVAPGEVVTVNLPHITIGNMYAIIVKFKEDVLIQNPVIENFQGVKQNFLVNNSLFNPKYYKEDLGVSPEGKYFENIRNYTAGFQNQRYPGLYNFDEEFLGGNLLILPININNNGTTNKTLEFDLSSSCEVLMIWNEGATKQPVIDYCEENGWVATTSSLMFCHAGATNSAQVAGVVYKKTFYVKPGEVERIRLFDFPASSRQLMVMARPININ